MKVPQATFLLVTATAASAALDGGHGGTDESSSAKAGKLFKSSKGSSESASKSAKAYSAKSAKASSHASADTAASAASRASAKSEKSAGAHASAKSAKSDGCPADFLDARAASSLLEDDNKCAGAKLALDNKLCVDLGVAQPQAGGNVTKGYRGDMDVGDLVPTTGSYLQSGMCPVNVHWHLGTEHYSLGEYDEHGDGPHGGPDDWPARRLAEGEVRDGFRCRHYDADDAKFTKEYAWEHCVGMEVGETYEVHWPHSAAGACGTVDQYQTPFYDGVFCNLSAEAFATLGAQDIAAAVGVHGQVFTIVNDEAYFYPDLIRGMVVDASRDMGTEVTKYTGSTTGTSRDNEVCSQYAPITWQVDRKCHLISASSFDKLCYDMKMQRDDMSDDLHAHGSRILVDDAYVADNQVSDRKRLRG